MNLHQKAHFKNNDLHKLQLPKINNLEPKEEQIQSLHLS